MSIMSDLWIQGMCERPRFAHIENSISNRTVGFFQNPTTALERFLFERWERGTPPATMFEPYIRELDPQELSDWEPMIQPFHPESINRSEHGNKILSKGLSSYGYDISLARCFKVFTNMNPRTIDPKEFDESCYVEVIGDHCVIPPNSFILAHTNEYFNIPPDILSIVITKSTVARCGATVTATALEPGWEGNLTLEIANHTSLPLIVNANEGIAQLLFLQGEQECKVNYRDRSGKYMMQGFEPVNPKI